MFSATPKLRLVDHPPTRVTVDFYLESDNYVLPATLNGSFFLSPLSLFPPLRLVAKSAGSLYQVPSTFFRPYHRV